MARSGTTARRQKPVSPPTPRQRRQRTRLLLIVLALVALGGAGAGAAYWFAGRTAELAREQAARIPKVVVTVPPAPPPTTAPPAAAPAAAKPAAPATPPGPPPLHEESVAAIPAKPAEAPSGVLQPIMPKPGSHPAKSDGAPTGPPAGAEAALIEYTPSGPLPRIAADGKASWSAYARPFTAAPNTPRVAVLVVGLGLSAADTSSAINRLPADVSLAFSPYAGNLARWLGQARTAGHEVLLEVPMEPMAYPNDDPGPNSLLIELPSADNVKRLDWAMGRGAGYVGLVNDMGSRFTGDAAALRPVLAEMKQRGVLFVDRRTAPHSVAGPVAAELSLPHASADLTIDRTASPAAIDAALASLVAAAKANGSAVGIATAKPVTIDRLTSWADKLGADGVALAPVSAVAVSRKTP